MRLLITGANGFVGHRVSDAAEHRNWHVKKQIRNSALSEKKTIVTDVQAHTNWLHHLQDIDCIVHCAARVHQMADAKNGAGVLQAYREVNTFGTLSLARQAAEAGVKRFVFISSIKVNGEQTLPDHPYLPEVFLPPSDPYGLSKYEAEIGLKKIAQQTGLEVVIIRPPLVYGEGVKANFQSMMNIVRKGIPLPLGAINNRRSLVYIDNLVSLIMTSCTHPNAVGKTFLVSDNHDVSTTRLIKQIAKSMGKPNRLLPLSQRVLEFIANMLGKSDIANRLCGNLQVDISDTIASLDWTPPVSFEQGIANTVEAYLNASNLTK
ncbi:NAD-dependent dehydratase [Enterovibrio norvegicus FF-162]|uniref:UDP-glucose 4-epimerase family protein n=1 Tax=Enterovibrio norvegicus TaxID=188144 RepID=UPI00031D5BEB|nr:SDR family oxidoreductase [Enterovibrio norvegicus]OEE83868.1 NAD-dependent dehydratase [Enterovibrio norvegicus FF-162]